MARAFIDVDTSPAPGLSFTIATPDDRAFLCALYAQSREEELAPVPWPDDAKRAFLENQFTLQDTQYRANYVDADFLVVRRDGAPIGRIYVHRVPGEIRLMEIAIEKSQRGQGFGRALVTALVREADARGDKLTLHVEPNNVPAHTLYRSLGFVLAEDRGIYHFLERAPASVS